MLAVDHEHVLGLEIAMNEPLRVQRLDRGRELPEQRERGYERLRAAGDHVRERLSVQTLHRQVRPPVRKLSYSKHLHDRRMSDLLELLRLGEKLRTLLACPRKSLVEDFERDPPGPPLCLIHDPAAAVPEYRFDAEVS